MPSGEVIEENDDLYPKTDEDHAEWISRCQDMFQAADSARRPFELRWKRFYKLWRSYVQRRQGDWRSKVFLPYVFWVIESIIPRISAALPDFTVLPIAEDDVENADELESLLRWAANRSGLDYELIVSNLDALIMGTGILKSKVVRQTGFRMLNVPVENPVQIPMPITDPATGAPLTDMNGQPMMDTGSAEAGLTPPLGGPLPGQNPLGLEGVGQGQGQQMADLGISLPLLNDLGEPEYEQRKDEVTLYQGPAAESIDIFNFWVAPEATSIDDARYVIQRYWRSKKYVAEKIKDGVWRLPDGFKVEEGGDPVNEPGFERLQDIGMGGDNSDSTRHAVRIDEYWTDDYQIVVMNQKAILRIAENPYMHGQKPYVRIVDHLDPHQFWGIGETEIIEGLQDLANALTNQRIDNVRLLLNAMFILDTDAVVDLRDLQMRPGGAIRVQNMQGRPISEVVQRLNLGDVTSSGFEEVAEAERMIEKISGVNAYTSGGEALDQQNTTATGAAIVSEQGNNRYAHKIRLEEITGLKRLAEHYGTIMQQYMPEEMSLRIEGQGGEFSFKHLTPESIAGGFDFDVEAESSTQTQSMRQNQAMSLFNTLVQNPDVNQKQIVEDLLKSFGKKNLAAYQPPPPQPVMDPNTGQMVDPTTGQPLGPGQMAPPGSVGAEQPPLALAPPPVGTGAAGG